MTRPTPWRYQVRKHNPAEWGIEIIHADDPTPIAYAANSSWERAAAMAFALADPNRRGITPDLLAWTPWDPEPMEPCS